MSRLNRRDCIATLAAATALPFAGAARADTFPDRPIRMVVPYAPGGGSDFVARLLAQKLTESTGWSVVVDNKAGASGIIGTDAVAKSPADGLTLLLADAAHATNAAVQPKLPFDPLKDFAPLTLVGSSPQLLVAHPGLPANSLKELLALPRAQTAAYGVGTPGQGTGPQLLYEQLKLKTGMQLVHVPYKGGALALADAVGGQVPMVINSIPACMPHIKAGRLKVLAIASTARDPKFPDVQTFAESVPGVVGSVWYGVVAPARVPADVQQALTTALNKVLELPEVKGKLADAFIDPMARGPQAFSDFLRTDIERWQGVVKQTGFVLGS